LVGRDAEATVSVLSCLTVRRDEVNEARLFQFEHIIIGGNGADKRHTQSVRQYSTVAVSWLTKKERQLANCMTTVLLVPYQPNYSH
jgi:hypothetical protein